MPKKKSDKDGNGSGTVYTIEDAGKAYARWLPSSRAKKSARKGKKSTRK